MKRRRTNGRSNSTHDLSVDSTPEGTSRNAKRGAKSAGGTQRPSRLQPSEPLHMTTRSRRATHSATNSISSGESRRSSLNGVHDHLTPRSVDEDDARPRKRARAASTKSSIHASPVQVQVGIDDAQMSDQSHTDAQDMSRSNSQSSTDSAKRKRDSEPLDDSAAKTNGEMNGTAIEDDDDADDDDDENADTVKDLQKLMPRPKRRSTRTRRSLEAPLINSGNTSSNTTPPLLGDDENDLALEDVESGVTISGHGPAEIKKRLPGRRRAPHENPEIEAALRQQLMLRMGYRQVAKALKIVELELVDRAIKELDENPDAHTSYPEFDQVNAALDKILDDKIAGLDRQFAIQTDTLRKERSAEEWILREQAAIKIRDIRDEHATRNQYRLLEIERMMKGETGAATEPEFDLLPPLQREVLAKDNLAVHPLKSAPISSKYGSRSRAFIETEKLVAQAVKRHTLEKYRTDFTQANLGEFDDDIDTDHGGFATYDERNRDHAVSVFNARQLVEAAEAVENGTAFPTIKVIPNEDATNLQFLADLIVNDARASSPAKKPNRDYSETPTTPASRMTVEGSRRSPEAPPSAASAAMSLDSAHEDTLPPILEGSITSPESTRRELIPVTELSRDAQATTRPDGTPKSTSAKIMDLLNKEEPQHSPYRPPSSRFEPQTTNGSSTHGAVSNLLPPIRDIGNLEGSNDHMHRSTTANSGFWSTLAEVPLSPRSSRRLSVDRGTFGRPHYSADGRELVLDRSLDDLAAHRPSDNTSMGPPHRRASIQHDPIRPVLSPVNRPLPPIQTSEELSRSTSQDQSYHDERRRSTSTARDGMSPGSSYRQLPSTAPSQSRSLSQDQPPQFHDDPRRRPSYAGSPANIPPGHYSPAPQYGRDPHGPPPHLPPYGYQGPPPGHPHSGPPSHYACAPHAHYHQHPYPPPPHLYPPPASSPPVTSPYPPIDPALGPGPNGIPSPYGPPGAPGGPPGPPHHYQMYSYPPQPYSPYPPPNHGPPPPQQQRAPRKRNSRGGSSNPSHPPPPSHMQTQFSVAHPQIPGKQPLLPAPVDSRHPPPATFPPQPGHTTTFPSHPPRSQGPTSGEQVLPKKRHRQYSTVPGTIFRDYQPPKRQG